MNLFLTHWVTVVTVLFGVIPGNSEHVCDFDRTCLPVYNNMKSVYEDQPGDLASLCPLSKELKDCMKRASRKCRGDLNYHFLEKLVRDLNGHIGAGKNCVDGMVKGSEENSSSSSQRNNTQHEVIHHGHHGRRDRNRSRSSSSASSQDNRCAPKVTADSSTAGCALFGLTNLKSFSESLNYTDISYCSLSGAWSLIDTHEFAVQITNKGGLSPLPKDITATTLVTVMIKSTPCSEQKVYQATFDEVPGMFSDGSTQSGNVIIETITESEHVKIHFPYLSTTIDVIKVIDKIPIPSLAVTIKMPRLSAHELMSEPQNIRGLPLCFYGCPRAATTKQRSPEGIMARSAPHSTNNNYYRSRCPDPGTLSTDELPQSDSASHPTGAHPHHRGEETEFSKTLSAEFLSQASFSTDNDFGGQRSQRSSSSNTAVICASLNKVHDILSDTSPTQTQLSFPGDGHFHDDSGYVSYSSALTSQSAPMSKFHFVFVYFSVMFLIFGWR